MDNLQQQNQTLVSGAEEKDAHLHQLQSELYRVTELYENLFAEKSHLENAIRMLEVESSCRCQPRSPLYNPSSSHRPKPPFPLAYGHSSRPPFSPIRTTFTARSQYRPRQLFDQTTPAFEPKIPAFKPERTDEPGTALHSNPNVKKDSRPPPRATRRGAVSEEEPELTTKHVRFDIIERDRGVEPSENVPHDSSLPKNGEDSSHSKLVNNFPNQQPENKSDDVIGSSEAFGAEEIDVIVYHDGTFDRLPNDEIMKEEGLRTHRIYAPHLSDVVRHFISFTTKPARAVLLHTGADDVLHIQDDVVVESVLEIRELSLSRDMTFIWSCMIPTPGNSTTGKKRQVVNALVSSKVAFMEDVTVVRHDEIDGDICENDGIDIFTRNTRLGICQSLGIAYTHLLKKD